MAEQAESADIALTRDAGYWSWITESANLAQTRGGVEIRVIWSGVTEASCVPAVRALSVSEPQSYIGLRLRIENGTTSDATIRETGGMGTIFTAGGTRLVTNLGEVRVRDFGNSEGRPEIPPGTFRTYDLVFLGD